jgi:class 3 adenylate cyclase
MSDNKNFRKLKIFVASPGDVIPEREQLKSVVERLNQPGSIADNMGLVLEVLDWKTHIASKVMGNKETELENLPVDDWDLFIGILWHRFGLPAGVDKGLENEFESVSEEDFRIAYNAWKENRRPQVAFYRCKRPVTPMEFNLDQLGRVESFVEQLNYDPQKTGIFKVFKDTNEFERIVSYDLLNYLQKFEREILSPQRQEAVVLESLKIAKPLPEDRIKKELKDGNIYDLAFLRIDVVDSSTIAQKHPQDKVKALMSNFHKFVFEIINRYDGDQFSWEGDGGIFAFWQEKACDNVVLSGIKILNDIKVFNLDKKANPVGVPIKLRIAAHWGPVEFKIPLNEIVSNCINFLSHLEKYGTLPETFSVTDILYNKLSTVLKNELNYEKIFKNNSIYSYRTSPKEAKLSEHDIKDLLKKVKEKVEFLIGNTRKTLSQDIDNIDYELMRKNVEEIYKNIEFFYKCFVNYDEWWSSKYFQKLVNYIKAFLDQDRLISDGIEQIYIEHTAYRSENPNLSNILRYMGILRTNSIPNLKKLLRQFELFSEEERDISIISRDNLFQKIDNLIEADDFNEEMAFVELFLFERERLIEYISVNNKSSRYKRLITRLWKLTDFVLIKDSNIRKNEVDEYYRMVFHILEKKSTMSNYFNVIPRLLKVDQNPDKKLVEDQFRKNGITPEESDIIIVLKCLLIFHKASNIRKYIIKNFDIHKLWEIIAFSETPLRVLQEIAEELSRIKDNDIMKIFFDLTLQKLIREVNNTNHHLPLHRIRLMIIIFYQFDFFVESEYFRRLEDLRLCFISRAKHYSEIKIEGLEHYGKELKREIEKQGEVKTTIPKCLTKLPHPIQRRLARDGNYIGEFIKSPISLIALETRRHINLNNIDLVLKSRMINGLLFSELLKYKDLFRKSSTIYLALSHPKCNSSFANNYIYSMSKLDLTKIASDSNANSEVRNRIKYILKTKFKVNV